MTWQPTAQISTLKLRAQMLATLREFFQQRNVLEVDTPLLCRGTVTDPNIFSMTVQIHGLQKDAGEQFYLQTSPEFAMKRLLCAGSGAIYQICKAFRDGEAGSRHNPEFTMLEWYRPGYDHHMLMAEVDELLQTILGTPPASFISYQNIFQEFLGINPLKASLAELQLCAKAHGISDTSHLTNMDKDDWLNFLISHSIEPFLGQDRPTFIYDFPASQAALAKIRQVQGEEPVAERFEVFIAGMEIANGFHELGDSAEQRARFVTDLHKRAEKNIAPVAIDEKLLQALEHGLPACAGVAVGLDRLMMLLMGMSSIAEVVSFAVGGV